MLASQWGPKRTHCRRSWCNEEAENPSWIFKHLNRPTTGLMAYVMCTRLKTRMDYIASLEIA